MKMGAKKAAMFIAAALYIISVSNANENSNAIAFGAAPLHTSSTERKQQRYTGSWSRFGTCLFGEDSNTNEAEQTNVGDLYSKALSSIDGLERPKASKGIPSSEEPIADAVEKSDGEESESISMPALGKSDDVDPKIQIPENIPPQAKQESSADSGASPSVAVAEKPVAVANELKPQKLVVVTKGKDEFISVAKESPAVDMSNIGSALSNFFGGVGVSKEITGKGQPTEKAATKMLELPADTVSFNEVLLKEALVTETKAEAPVSKKATPSATETQVAPPMNELSVAKLVSEIKITGTPTPAQASLQTKSTENKTESPATSKPVAPSVKESVSPATSKSPMDEVSSFASIISENIFGNVKRTSPATQTSDEKKVVKVVEKSVVKPAEKPSKVAEKPAKAQADVLGGLLSSVFGSSSLEQKQTPKPASPPQSPKLEEDTVSLPQSQVEKKPTGLFSSMFAPPVYDDETPSKPAQTRAPIKTPASPVAAKPVPKPAPIKVSAPVQSPSAQKPASIQKAAKEEAPSIFSSFFSPSKPQASEPVRPTTPEVVRSAPVQVKKPIVTKVEPQAKEGGLFDFLTPKPVTPKPAVEVTQPVTVKKETPKKEVGFFDFFSAPSTKPVSAKPAAPAKVEGVQRPQIKTTLSMPTVQSRPVSKLQPSRSIKPVVSAPEAVEKEEPKKVAVGGGGLFNFLAVPKRPSTQVIAQPTKVPDQKKAPVLKPTVLKPAATSVKPKAVVAPPAKKIVEPSQAGFFPLFSFPSPAKESAPSKAGKPSLQADGFVFTIAGITSRTQTNIIENRKKLYIKGGINAKGFYDAVAASCKIAGANTNTAIASILPTLPLEKQKQLKQIADGLRK